MSVVGPFIKVLVAKFGPHHLGDNCMGCCSRFIVVAGIFTPLLLNVLRFNDLFYGGDSAGVDGLLEVIFLIECLLVLL